MLVAISGGPDSTALLLALVELRFEVVAAHFDHALRPTSDADADHVRELCQRLNVPIIVERRTKPLTQGSLQAAARAARYEFLERARLASGCDLIATAHTVDDVAETIAMNILRGTDVRGLCGIPPRNRTVVRPLLATDRAAIDTFLKERAAETRSDPSNRDLRFLRARVRHLLLPAVPGLKNHLIRIAALAQAAEARLGSVPDPAPSDPACEPAKRRRLLHRLYVEAGGTRPGLSRTHLTAMDRLLCAARTGATLSLPGRLTFRVLPNGAAEIVGPPATDIPQPGPAVRERPCPGCDDPEAVHLRSGTLSLGTRRPGLRLRPAGGPGTRKLQDVFVDAKVPRHEREAYPLVFLDGRLAWAPGLAVDQLSSTPRSLPGRHVWLERGSTSPMVRSGH